MQRELRACEGCYAASRVGVGARQAKPGNSSRRTSIPTIAAVCINRSTTAREVAGTPEISAHKASYAVVLSHATTKTRVSALAGSRVLKCLRPSQARPSPASGVRLRDGFAAERRRCDKHRIEDQELKRRPFPCLINSAAPSTYRLGKSVRTTRATPIDDLSAP